MNFGRLFSILILSFFSFGILQSQIGFSPRIDSVINLSTYQTLSKLNRELSGDTSTIIGGSPYTILSRYAYSVHNPKAAEYIFEKLQSFGLTALYMDYRPNGRNIYAVKTGTKYPNQKYIICGHYDDMPSGSLAPGADDNASGTCAVLEAARLLAPLSFEYTIIFIAFDEEELGLIGSKAFADSCYYRGDSLVGVLNFDMIAYDGNNDNFLDLRTNTNSIPLTDNVKLIFNVYQPLLVPTRVISTIQNSDHASFWNRGYKAFLGIESYNDFNPYYHTVNDNFSHVNMNYYLRFTRAAIASLMTLSNNYFIWFTHTPITSTSDTGPQTATVIIQSPHRIAGSTNAPRLYYKVNSGSFNYVNAFYTNQDTFKFSIPGQSVGSTISYYMAAQDSAANFVGTLPAGGRGLNPPGTNPPTQLFTYSILTGIANENLPAEFELSQNYPNPFNSSTKINFKLPAAKPVQLVVSDMIGNEISVLVNDKIPGGEHVVQFNASYLASGVYFYTLYIDGLRFSTKKMILVK